MSDDARWGGLDPSDPRLYDMKTPPARTEAMETHQVWVAMSGHWEVRGTGLVVPAQSFPRVCTYVGRCKGHTIVTKNEIRVRYHTA